MKDFLYVCSYTDFKNLAHQPKGKVGVNGITCYELINQNGELKKKQEVGGFENPAFLRFDPSTTKLYACTESINENGYVIAYNIDYKGKLRLCSTQNTHGMSTCYLTLDSLGRKLLFVNYWDSSLGSFPLHVDGSLHPVKGFVMPKQVLSRHRVDHLTNRQLEPHAHALVLDPFGSNLAYVPDLGKDLIQQYRYDSKEGTFEFLNGIPSCTGPGPHGPRYIEFHPNLPNCYVVNELSSKVTMFEYNSRQIDLGKDTSQKVESLQIGQVVPTIPNSFSKLNTCGRIHVEKTGKFVLVSNRGHDSITTFMVNQKTGMLKLIGYFKTLGKTPRHFQLNDDNRILVVANQDSDNLVVFYLDSDNGKLRSTGLSYDICSPNFVQFVRIDEVKMES
jgi:6-phosphogluconolactonase (cycloisomerase 2 family)